MVQLQGKHWRIFDKDGVMYLSVDDTLYGDTNPLGTIVELPKEVVDSVFSNLEHDRYLNGGG